MIRDLIRKTRLRGVVADTIGFLCLIVVMLAWLFIAAALTPAEAVAYFPTSTRGARSYWKDAVDAIAKATGAEK